MLISIPLGVTFGVGGIRNFRSDHIAGPKTVVTLRDAGIGVMRALHRHKPKARPAPPWKALKVYRFIQ
jgi:hypothetical protein